MQLKVIEFALGTAGAHDAAVTTFAPAVVSAIRRLLKALQPVVGKHATRALYVRSLHLARSSFKRPENSDLETLDALLAVLEQDLLTRQPEEAAAAGRALLQSLVDLLISLIGEHLTTRMVRKAWGISPSDLPSEEKPL